VTSTTRCLPMRRRPTMARPSSACSGGSNVFSALMPGASVDSISAPRSAASSRRAVISTSGSSGTSPGYPAGAAAPGGERRRAAAGSAALAADQEGADDEQERQDDEGAADDRPHRGLVGRGAGEDGQEGGD